MSHSTSNADPYAIVLDDLRRQRDKIDVAIQAIQAVRGMSDQTIVVSGASATLTVGKVSVSADVIPRTSEHTANQFEGLSVSEAAKKVLHANAQRTMSSADIAGALRAGSYPMTTNDPANTVASVLTRRFNNVGDIVRVSRGQWGLAEWYPETHFARNPDAARKPDDQSTDEDNALAIVPDRNGDLAVRHIPGFHGRIEE